MDSYDLIVIGTGTAAQVTAARLRRAGRSVAMIDHRPFGGTCALRGCDPKKMLVSGAEAVDWARRMHRRGVVGEVRINWKELIAFKRTFTDPVPKKREESFAKQGIDAFHGMAHFDSPDTVIVEGRALKGRNIVIAAGARPVPLDFPGAEHAITSDAFMELEDLPKRIVMVGGGYLAAEFSHIAARAGAKVTMLQRAERMLRALTPSSWAGLWRNSRKSASRRRPAPQLRQSSTRAAASACAPGLRAERSRLTPILWFMPLAALPISTRSTWLRPGSPSNTGESS